MSLLLLVLVVCFTGVVIGATQAAMYIALRVWPKDKEYWSEIRVLRSIMKVLRYLTVLTAWVVIYAGIVATALWLMLSLVPFPVS